MKIIHLADFHLDNEDLPVNHQRIIKALIVDLKNYKIDEETLLIFSGDFLNLGGKNFKNPNISFEKFNELVFEVILSNFPCLQGKIFFVAGNHDLDRSKIKASNKALKKQILHSEESREDIYNELKEGISGLELYNTFKADFFSKDLYKDSKLTFFENTFKLAVGSELVGIAAINSSTFCYENNDFGNLLLFEKQLSNSLIHIYDCEVKIAILHHPINFYHQSEREKIKSFLEKEFDLVFLGHTHRQESEFNQTLNGHCYFSVGKSLNGEVDESSPYTNGYSIIEFITNQKIIVNLRKFNNKNDTFLSNSDYGSEEGLQEIFINKNLVTSLTGKLEINSNFRKYLSDVGANLTHQSRDVIKLDDIYIYPNLDNYDMSSEERKITVNSRDLIDKINGNEIQRLIVLGETSAGKTSFCKKAFEKIFEKGEYYPVLITGEDVKSTDIKILEKLKNTALNEQYLSNAMPSDKKPFFIIDNLNDSKLEPKFKRKFLENLINNDISFLITWNEFFTLSEVFDSLVSLVNVHEILPFGIKYRYQLIEKWISFKEYENEKEKTSFLYEIEKLINSIVGKNLVPAYPLYILTILQSTELFPTENFEQSTFGHYYDILIKSALSKFLTKNSDIEKYYSYLSELAFELHNNKDIDSDKKLTEQKFIKFHEKFVSEYNIHKNGFVEMEKNLRNSDVIVLLNGKYGFRYPYIYYYFLGKYLADNLDKSEIKDEIKFLSNSLYNTSSANIYLFLSHHSKAEFVTNIIVENARSLFKDEDILNFSTDIAQINELVSSTSTNISLDTSNTHKENKIESLESEEKNEQVSKINNFEEIEDVANSINYISEINKAFKTIEILGLILKNRYASLKTAPKLEIAKEIYFLGLRTTSTIFKTLVEGEDFIKNDLLDIIGTERTLSKLEKEEITKRIIFNLYYVTSYSIFKRISNSIATKDLEPTFNDLKNMYPENNAIALIDISNKLEYSSTFPFSDVDKVVNQLKNNKFPYFLLRRLSLNYLRMFPMKEQEQQRICSKLEIPIQVQRQIEMTSTTKKASNLTLKNNGKKKKRKKKK